jgi:preprotein translocase subunit SecA
MSNERLDQITVRLRKAGWEVEITCAEDKLKQAIEAVLSSIPTAVSSQSVDQRSLGPESANKTCRGLILDLWHESWFSESRSLSQVHEEIARRGYHYDRTAVSHSLTDLVRENVLTREGPPRNYTYIQKRPSGVTSQLTAGTERERADE